MKPWKFSRPKGPGFGISRQFYLSVLCSRASLPSILDVLNPKGEDGAVAGFGAPLTGDTDKSVLARPMQRGAYVVASRDRKTVLRMLVLSPQEAGWDPEFFARSFEAQRADPDLVARVRGTWNLAQLNFESHDPEVYPSLDFLLGVVARLADLSDGVVADPMAQRYRLPYQLQVPDRVDPKIDARDHVSVQFRSTATGEHAYTLGMQKFGLPEYEILGLREADEAVATRFLQAVNQRVLLGDLTENGDRFGVGKLALEARAGGLDRGMWEGVPVFELIPPTGQPIQACLEAWQAASK